jgi:hypothetical protein
VERNVQSLKVALDGRRILAIRVLVERAEDHDDGPRRAVARRLREAEAVEAPC